MLNWGDTGGELWVFLADLSMDLNLDGADLTLFLPAYNNPNFVDPTLADGDFNGDGVVDDIDLTFFALWASVDELQFV